MPAVPRRSDPKHTTPSLNRAVPHPPFRACIARRASLWLAALSIAIGMTIMPAKAQLGAGYIGGNFEAKMTANCIVYSVAGGTSDAITIPQLVNPLTPCLPRQTLLGLTLTATNTTTTPTLTPLLGPTQTIIQANGSAVTVGQLVSGTMVLLGNDGTHWRLLSGATGGGGSVSITATSPIVVTPSPITGTGVVSISPVCGDSTGLALWPSCNQTWGKTQRGNEASLSIAGSIFTPDFNVQQHPIITLIHASCPCTIANPANQSGATGQVGIIVVQQSATGSDTVTWGANYKWPGGTAPTLSTAANAVDIFPYLVFSSTDIFMGTGGQNYAP